MLKDFVDLEVDYMYVDSGRAGYQGVHVNKGLVGDEMPVEPLGLIRGHPSCDRIRKERYRV